MGSRRKCLFQGQREWLSGGFWRVLPSTPCVCRHPLRVQVEGFLSGSQSICLAAGSRSKRPRDWRILPAGAWALTAPLSAMWLRPRPAGPHRAPWPPSPQLQLLGHQQPPGLLSAFGLELLKSSQPAQHTAGWREGSQGPRQWRWVSGLLSSRGLCGLPASRSAHHPGGSQHDFLDHTASDHV